MPSIDATGGIQPAPNDLADATNAGAKPSGRQRWRKRLVLVLVVLTSIATLTSVIGVWSHRTIMNTDAWMDIVGPLADDPAVTDAVSVALTKQVFELVQPADRIKEALPPKASFLAEPITTAVQGYVEQGVAQVLQSDQFKTFWNRANREAHESAIALLRGQPVLGFQAAEGVVTFNFLPLISRTLQFIAGKAPGLLGDRAIPDITDSTPPAQARQELTSALGLPVPDTFGVITVFKSDQLLQAQQAVKLFDGLVILMLVVTVVLLVATLALSRNRRRTTIQLAVGVVLAMALGDAAINAFQKQIVALISGESAKRAGIVAISGLVQELKVTTHLLIGVGLIVMAVMFLIGDTRLATATRRAASNGLNRGQQAMDDRGLASPVSALPFLADHLAAFRIAGALAAVVSLFLVDVTWGSLALIALALALYEGVIAVLGAPPASSGDSEVPQERTGVSSDSGTTPTMPVPPT